MGVLLSTALRVLLYGAALLLNTAASLVLVRRLPPAGYAAYQTLTKRLNRYILLPQALIAMWVYRYVAEGVEGAAAAGLLAALATSALGFAAGAAAAWMLVGGGIAALLAGAALAALALWPMAATVVDAVRPVRSAAAVLLVRLLYSLGVVALVYLLGAGLPGALLAVAVAYASGSLAALRWARGRGLAWPGPARALGLLREWLRASYSTAPGALAQLLYGLDVVLGYRLWGPGAVAGFFAATSLFLVAGEAFLWGFRYLHSYVLTTGDAGSALNAVRLAVWAAAPLLVYAALHPLHYVYLLNPGYSWAAGAVPLAAAAGLLLVAGDGLSQLALGLIRGSAGEAAADVARLNTRYLLAPAVYLAAEALGLALAGGRAAAVAAWAAALLAMASARLLVPAVEAYRRLPPGERGRLLAGLARMLVLYPALAALASLPAAPPGPPAPRFWSELRLLAAPLAEAYTLYTALSIAVDGLVRATLRRALARLPGAPRRG